MPEESRRNSCSTSEAGLPPSTLTSEDVFSPSSLNGLKKMSIEKQETRPSPMQRAKLILTGSVVVLGGSFHFGYQISLINPLADVLQDFITESVNQTYNTVIDEEAQRIVWPSVAGLLFIGAFIGAILLLSFLLSFWSQYFESAEFFVLGRFVSGLGIGMFTTTQAVYLTEISPIMYRGFMGSLTGFSKSIGFVLASGIGIPQVLGTKELWHWAFLIECFPSIVILIGMFFVFYDSPVYLIKKGEDKKAHKCLELYHSKPDVDQRIPEIYSELEKNERKGKVTLNSIFHCVPTRKAFIICVLINVTVSFSGIMAVSFFGTFLLQGIGFTESGAAMANCFASFSGLLGNIFGTLTIDKIGRRKLIIGGLGILALLNCALMFMVFLFKFTDNINIGYAFLIVFMLFLFVFSLGVGPLALFIATELATADYRPWMQSASISTQYLTCFISPLIFFPAYEAVGPLTFLIFIVPLLLCCVYLYFNLPETKNRPIEDIVDELGGIFKGPSITSPTISKAIDED
ncbi:hypothetical protein FO519_006592 [Halicephalobus sp. NKZ332]|nr:hypothetical protein FO519_006592 [Halicephalobus sp. NKZ332]